jgi:hypothetical protein
MMLIDRMSALIVKQTFSLVDETTTLPNFIESTGMAAKGRDREQPVCVHLSVDQVPVTVVTMIDGT